MCSSSVFIVDRLLLAQKVLIGPGTTCCLGDGSKFIIVNVVPGRGACAAYLVQHVHAGIMAVSEYSLSAGAVVLIKDLHLDTALTSRFVHSSSSTR